MKRFLLSILFFACGILLFAQGNHRNNGRGDSRHHPNRDAFYYCDCASPEQMDMVMQALNEQSFDDKKLSVAKLCVTIGYFCVDDLRQMAAVFSFDENRLDFLKYAYPFCIDRENYPTLRKSFAFQSNFDALLDYLYPGMRQ